MTARPHGVVLAGGAGRRMGGGKPLVMLGGHPLVWHVAARLTPQTAALACAGDAAAAAAMGAMTLADPPGAPRGPLAGVLAGLLWAEALGAERIVTAPCDAPFLPGDLVERLSRQAGSAAIAYAATAEGPHPLCALWRTALAPALARALESGVHPPVRAFAAAHGAATVTFPEAAAFANINTPEDLKAAQRRLGEVRPGPDDPR